jgi:cysteine desulfurase/selenocysteine lyase
MEHHSNIVPWQLLCERKKAILKVLPFDDNGELLVNQLESLISPKTKLVAVTQVSNALGTVNPIKQIIEIAHSKNVKVLIDGAQAIQHTKVDVQELECDFYVFGISLGATGVGVLYGKKELLEQMPPYHGGGEMIESVSFTKTTYNVLPYKFEAGTPNYIDIIAFEKALQYLTNIGLVEIEKYETELLDYATSSLKSIERLKIIGNAEHKSGVISFIIDGVHPSDLGTLLDHMGIAIRTGTHCAEPVMQHFGITGTARVSFAFYNTFEEVDILTKSIKKALMMLK